MPRSIPEHLVQIKDPMVILMYVGPLCSQSRHFLLSGLEFWISLMARQYLSSCFPLRIVVLDILSH